MAQEAILEKVNGEVHISKSFDFMCSQLRNGRYRVKIERFTEPRTMSQNALMWLWFTCIEQETGTDKQDVHDYYCNRFLRRTSYFRGKEMVITGSTSKLNTVQMTDFLNKVQADAAAELGITLPLPADRYYNEFINELIPHLAFLCEQKEADGKDSIDELPEEIFSTFEVTGYTVSGSDDNEGVVLVGKRFLKSKKVLNLIAPFTMFNNENEEYKHAFELQQAIEACNYEVEQYLTAKKWAVVQQELPFDGDIPTDIAADPVGDAAFEEEANEFLKQVVEQSGTTLTIDGKKVKPRNKSKKVKIKEPAA